MNAQKQPDERDFRYLQFVTGRHRGLSDMEIADKLGFGSPEALFQRLAYDGYPVCAVCGTAHVGADHCEKSAKEDEPKQRKARTGNKNAQDKPLPPAGDAADLFREALDKLAREVEELEHRRESYTGGRYVATDVYSGAMFVKRADVSADKWRELCERYGHDVFDGPDEDELFIPDSHLKDPVGGDTAPGWPLPALIATYLLAGESLERLLEVLHPDVEAAGLEQLRIYIEGRKKPDGRDGLKVLAQQAASLVRGAEQSRGKPPPSLSPVEQNVACSVTDYRKQGLSESEIAEKFAHKGITEQDVRRLGGFGLSWPDE